MGFEPSTRARPAGFTTGEPFAWKAADWARAQAVLDARGSPTRLLG